MKFNKNLFTYSGGYLNYNGKFVARFKYRGPVTAAKLKAVLVKYYTVENYFSRLEGFQTPLGILMKDGFLKHENGKIILDGKVLN